MKILNEAIRRLGKSVFSLVDAEDREAMAKAVSKTISSFVIFAVFLIGSAVFSVLSDALIAAVPGMWLEAMALNVASFICLLFDLLWLIDSARRSIRRVMSKGE